MAEISIREGNLPFEIPHVGTPCHTYYKIFGDLSSNSPRLVVLHGGPSAGHEYLLPFAQLWEQFGIPVIFYDQIGCASSTHLPDTRGDESLWQESLFMVELDNLLDSLRLRDGPGYYILGHSWGGRLAAAFAASRPLGLQMLVLASAIASTETVNLGNQLNRKALPPDVRLALEEEDEKGDVDSERFKDAYAVFLRTYFCRVGPPPPKELLLAGKNIAQDKAVRPTIYGPSPLRCTGSFRDWTVIPRLHQIAVPTLVYNGDFDTSHDVTTVPFFEHIPRVRWITFPNAGHMCHIEGPELRERVLRTVGEFLTWGSNTK